MSKKIALILFVFISINAFAGNKIKYYFNQPVDTTVATAVKAQSVINCSADTLIAYLYRAQYSLDICLYDFDNDTNVLYHNGVNVANAINNAYNRGVKIRWIYEASCGNSGLALLNTHINTLGSPQGYPNYTIMHNKFVIIDGNSSNPNDPIVWTGCLNWYTQQFNWDYNNIVIIQDSALAHAYLGEFNMMWGDTGIAPNLSASKFGQYKTDLGKHNFTIEGNHIELYFSPSDNTDSHIQSTIETANTDLYFGMYTFTVNTDAGLILYKYDSGIYVSGIDDSWSNSYSPYGAFTSTLGSHFKVYTETDTSLYHNKFLIVDPSDTCSDPTVLTGSHNWSNSANTHNDENTLIIHNDTAANLFYQYFKATFNSLGGVLTPQTGCTHVNVPNIKTAENTTVIYPNPANNSFSIRYQLATTQNVTIDIYNMIGQKVVALVTNELLEPGTHYINNSRLIPGVYFVRFTIGNETYSRKLVIRENR